MFKISNLLIFVTAVLLSACAVTRVPEYSNVDTNYIVVSKEDMTLALFGEENQQILQFDIACGAAYGNKQCSGDMKTPEGKFFVSEVRDARLWRHDFGDGKGEIKGAYGMYFIRLDTPPHKGIGIHGTHLPSSIGSRATEGCIRLNNRDLRRLIPYIRIGMPVEIYPSERDIEADKRSVD